MSKTISGDIKLGVSLETKSIKQSLQSIRKTVYEAFGGADAKGLEKQIKDTNRAIKQQEKNIEKVKQKLDELNSTDGTPKSITEMSKELQSLEKELKKTDAEFEKLSSEQTALASRKVDGLSMEQSLDSEQYARFQELDKMIIQNGQHTAELQDRISKLKAKISKLKANPNLTEEGKKYNAELKKATVELENQKRKLAELENQQSRTSDSSVRLGKSVSQFNKRLFSLTQSALIFSVVTKALTTLRQAFGKALMSNKQFANSVAQIKANLLTAFMPIYQIVLPALQALMNILAKVTAYIAQFISLITGKSVDASKKAANALYKQAAASGAAGGAAKDAAKETEKSTLAFDELNTISSGADTNTSSGGGGGGEAIKDLETSLGDGGELPPFLADLALTIKDVFFTWGDDMTAESITEKIITLAFSATGGILGFMVGGTKGAKIGIFLGAALSLLVNSVIFDHDGKLEATEIVKLIATLLNGICGAVIGFTLGGPVGAVIGLTISTGLGLLISEFMLDYGEKLTQVDILQLVVAGLTAIAGGILGFIVGGPAGMAIGIMAGAYLGLVLGDVTGDKDGNITKDTIWQLIKNLIAPLAGGVVGAVFGGPAGAAVGFVVGCILNLVFKQLEAEQWFTKEKWSTLWDDVRQWFSDGWKSITDWWSKTGICIWYKESVKPWFTKEKWVTLWNDVKQWFSDGWKSISDWWNDSAISQWFKSDGAIGKWFTWEAWQQLWADLCTWFGDGFGNIKTWMDENTFSKWFASDGVIGQWFTWDKWKTLFTKLKTAFNMGFKDAANAGIDMIERMVNRMIDLLNCIKFTVPDWVPGLGGKSWGINLDHIDLPHLAQGAVIPANREFLAVLGDQKRGTNIEAPADLIKQMVNEALEERGYSDNQTININFTGNLAQLARVLKPQLDKEATRKGVKLVKGGAY